MTPHETAPERQPGQSSTTTMNVTFTFEFVFQRCDDCGRYYAIEKGVTYFACPTCTRRSNLDRHYEIETLERRIRSLKSYIKRMRDNPLSLTMLRQKSVQQ